MKIAVDIASGERPLEELVIGCVEAVNQNSEIILTLVGNDHEIEKALNKKKFDSSQINIRHAEDVIGMSESPSIAIKQKRNSSVMIAARMVGHGEADAFFSPGNTGATLAAGLIEVGRLKGVMRPPLMSVLPNKFQDICMLDMGANVDCIPEYLVQFAVMGSVFAKRYTDIKNPRIALLNIGEEDSKGNALYKKTFERLEKLNINFVGNIEPNDMLKADKADVVVADGFSGNLVLKTMEGTASYVASLIKDEVKKNPASAVGALFMKPVFNKLKNKVSSDYYGSAILLGLKGGAFVGHGKTTALGMKSAIDTMYGVLQAKVNEHITKELQSAGVKKKGIF